MKATGLCECGCGQPAPLWPCSNRGTGRVRGQPARFIHGHNGRVRGRIPQLVMVDGYVAVDRQGHPRTNHGGRVREHLLVAERALGRPIPPGRPVHHVNGNKSDNRPCNLVICENDAYHNLLHRRQRALEACGHADWLKCKYCGRHDDPARLYTAAGRNVRHYDCHSAYMKAYKLARGLVARRVS